LACDTLVPQLIPPQEMPPLLSIILSGDVLTFSDRKTIVGNVDAISMAAQTHLKSLRELKYPLKIYKKAQYTKNGMTMEIGHWDSATYKMRNRGGVEWNENFPFELMALFENFDNETRHVTAVGRMACNKREVAQDIQ
jgi:hypothetical protein